MSIKDLYSPDNDLDLSLDAAGRLDLSIVDGEDQIRQEVETRLQMVRGQWFLDTRAGIPYGTSVFVKNPDLDLIAAELRVQALAVNGVTDVTSVNLTHTGLALTVSMVINGSLSVQTTFS